MIVSIVLSNDEPMALGDKAKNHKIFLTISDRIVFYFRVPSNLAIGVALNSESLRAKKR